MLISVFDLRPTSTPEFSHLHMHYLDSLVALRFGFLIYHIFINLIFLPVDHSKLASHSALFSASQAALKTLLVSRQIIPHFDLTDNFLKFHFLPFIVFVFLYSL